MADDGSEVLGVGALFSFQGRINRGTFWKLIVLMIVGIVAAGVLAAVLIPQFMTPGAAAGAEAASGGGGTAALVVIIAIYAVTIWISLATQVKRWHDMDRSGWFVLLSLIPAINLLVFLYLGFNPGSAGPNRFGAAPVRILM